MWELYILLQEVLRKEKEELMIDEVVFMMESMSTQAFKSSLRLMYGEEIDYGKKTPLELGLMFSDGISKNELFKFQDFVGTLSK